MSPKPNRGGGGGWGGGGGVGAGWGAGIGDKIHFTHSLLGQNCWKEWSFQLYSTAVLAQQHWNILCWQLLSVLWFLMSSVVGWHVRDAGSVLAVEFIHTTTLCCQSRPRFGCTWLPICRFDEKQWQQTKMSELKKVFTGLCRSYSSQGCPDSLICPNPPPPPPFFIWWFLFVYFCFDWHVCVLSLALTISTLHYGNNNKTEILLFCCCMAVTMKTNKWTQTKKHSLCFQFYLAGIQFVRGLCFFPIQAFGATVVCK